MGGNRIEKLTDHVEDLVMKKDVQAQTDQLRVQITDVAKQSKLQADQLRDGLSKEQQVFQTDLKSNVAQLDTRVRERLKSLETALDMHKEESARNLRERDKTLEALITLNENEVKRNLEELDGTI